MVAHAVACRAFAELLAERCRLGDFDKKVWAKAAGVSEKDWSKYTRGTALPRGRTFAIVAKKLFRQTPELLLVQLCERMAVVARRGIERDPQGRLRPISPAADTAPYASTASVLMLGETDASDPVPEILSLDGLSRESIAMLRATHAWLLRHDAADRERHAT